ncbi:unnamed protein product [Prorocentrum cordatum]|uniref:Inositol polyphosphate-related phosphatase domain-containing protein n=1 Tax=Prorocentrum cordatum TaxID=2364126 RepID=A0ABN9WP34_9DINO|nr:unnamed protein product [Polarella glacialis]
MVGLAIFVYVREDRDLVPLVGKIQMKSIKRGPASPARWGTKAPFAVASGPGIGAFNACFVNVHLASGTGKAKKRDKHMSKIIAGLVNEGSRSRAGCFEGFKSTETAGGCHFTAVLGDFNSRLELGAEVPLAKGSEGAMTVGGRPSEAPLEDWLCRDEMVNGRLESLKGFSEEPVRFPPTFGYVPGSDTFGRRYHPAWTDRVVYRVAAGARAEPQESTARSQTCCAPATTAPSPRSSRSRLNIERFGQYAYFVACGHAPRFVASLRSVFTVQVGRGRHRWS